MKRPALLDVNVLIALFDPDHVHHEVVHDWFADQRPRGWATCAVTEMGFLRVLANPRYGQAPAALSTLVDRLRTFRRSGHHVFWPGHVSLLDAEVFDLDHLGTHRHVTDVYLLGLAKTHGGHLATLDRSIPVKAVRGAGADILTVIVPS